MQKLIAIALVCSALLLSGCYNAYQSVYNPAPTATLMGTLPYSGHSEIIAIDDLDVAGQKLAQQGYLQIGSAHFTDQDDNKTDELLEHAQSVGADVVIHSDEFLGSERKLIRQTRREAGDTIVTQSHGTINGEDFTKTHTLTLPDKEQVYYRPITISHYAHSATFWRKAPQGILGAQLSNLPNEMRATLERNTGAYVEFVVDDSPAFNANLLPGDVIIALNEASVLNAADLDAQLYRLAGSPVTLTVMRKGNTIKLPVALNARPLPTEYYPPQQ